MINFDWKLLIDEVSQGVFFIGIQRKVGFMTYLGMIS